MRGLYEDTLKLPARPDGCPQGNYSVQVGPDHSPLMGFLTFGGSGVSIRAVTLAVPKGSLARWRARLSQRGARLIGRAWQFGNEHLCFVDDSDFDLALTETIVERVSAGANDQDAIFGFQSVEIEAGPSNELQTLLAAIDLRPGREEGPILRYEVPSRPSAFAVDLFRSPRMSFQHKLIYNAPQRLNFAVADVADLAVIERKLRLAGFDPLPFCGRGAALAVRLRTQRNLEIGFLCLSRPAA